MQERTDGEILEQYSTALKALNNPQLPGLAHRYMGLLQREMLEEIMRRELLLEAAEVYANSGIEVKSQDGPA